MFSPAGETWGIGEDWTSGMSSLQSINDLFLSSWSLSFTKKLSISLTSASVFAPRVCFDFIINSLRVEKNVKSLLFFMSTNHSR